MATVRKPYYGYNTAECLARYAVLLAGGRVYDAAYLSFIENGHRMWEPTGYMAKNGLVDPPEPPKWWVDGPYDQTELKIWLSAYILSGHLPANTLIPDTDPVLLAGMSVILRDMVGEEYIDWQSGAIHSYEDGTITHMEPLVLGRRYVDDVKF